MSVKYLVRAIPFRNVGYTNFPHDRKYTLLVLFIYHDDKNSMDAIDYLFHYICWDFLR